MSKNLEAKKQIVENISTQLASTGDSKDTISTVIFDYSRITVNEMNDLRNRLTKVNANLKVVKNTLIKRVFERLGVPLSTRLTGQSAVLIHDGKDFLSPLKTLYQFIGDTEKGSVVSGIFNNAIISKAQVDELSRLPSRLELIGQIAWDLTAPIRGFAYSLSGVQGQFIRVLEEIRKGRTVPST